MAGRFVGRARELAFLERALDDAAEGSGALVRLAGEPGIGKTRLAGELTRVARARGLRVGWAKAWTGGAPLGVVDDALASAGGPSPELARGERGASREALREELYGRVAAAAPLVLVLDDVHEADLDSLGLLAWLAPRLRTLGALVVTTERTVAAGATAEGTSRLAELSRLATTVALGGLDAPAIGELVTEAALADDGGRLAEAIHRATRGNALFVEGVLRAAVAGEPSVGGTLRFARDVEHAVLARVEAAGERVARVLRPASLLQRPFGARLLATVAGCDAAEVLDALDRALGEGLVEPAPAGQFVFRHGLVAEALASSLSSGARARLHGELARALAALDGGAAAPSELARHATLAVVVDGHAPALAAIERAAAQAAGLLAYDEEARLHRDAVEVLRAHAPGQQGALLVHLVASARALLRAGRRGDARAALLEAAALARAVGHRDALVEVAHAFRDTGEFGHLDREKLSLLAEAVALTEGQPAARARALAALASELWVDPDQAGRADALSREALELARAEGDASALHGVLAARFQALWGPAHAAERAALAEELRALAATTRDDEHLLAAHRHSMLVAIEVGDVPRFASELDDYEALARRMKRPALDENVGQRRLLLALLRGDLERARQLAELIHELGRRTQNPQRAMGRRFALAEIARQAGDRGALDALLPQLAGDADRLENQPFLRGRVAQLHALLGQREEAAAHLARYRAAARRGPEASLVTLAGLSFASVAAAELGDHEAQEELLARLAPHARLVVCVGTSVCFGAAVHYMGMLELALGRVEASDTLTRALALHEAMGAAPFVAETAGLLARAGARPAGAARPRRGERRAAPARLVRGAAGWSLEWDGRRAELGKSKGLALLAALVRAPREPIHVLDLVGAGELRLAAGQSDGPPLDEPAKAAYRARLRELRRLEGEADERGDPGHAAAARAEREALEGELARAVGLAGRDRVGGAAERARVAVAKSLRRALAVVTAAHPTAGAHLERSLKTGFSCAYDPDPGVAIDWTVTM